MALLRFFTFAAAVAVATSVSLEYPGFLHFHNWDTTFNDGASTALSRPDGGQIALDIGKDIVASDSSATVMKGIGYQGLSRIFFGPRNYNSDFDTFIAFNDTAGVSHVVCHVEKGGGNYPSARFLVCPEADTFDVLATFQLPPDLIMKSCQENPQCYAFLIKNDMTQGVLLGRTSFHATGYFQIPPD
jgi:hypothetical protein